MNPRSLPGAGSVDGDDAARHAVLLFPDRSERDVERHLEAWASWLRAAGRPETTIGLRLYHVRRVLDALRKQGISPWEASTEQLVLWLGDQSWGPETRRSARSSLRGFYSWAQITERRSDDPALRIPAIKVPRGVARPVPEDVYRTALAKADERGRLMVQLAAKCGLRRGEIACAAREHVQPELLGHSLHVVGKGGHERMVPLPDDLARHILAMPAGWLFPSTAPGGGHLSPEHVGKLVSRLLPDGWTCHTLRHRCATVAYASTRDVFAVQELLGHAKPETTRRYTQVPAQTVRAAMLAASA